VEVKLVVLEGKHKDRVIPLPETIFLIGRDPQCHIRPHCQAVSGLHCAIAAWAGKVRVRDLKSLNGTYLNGRPIQGEVVAGHGDQLQVGTLLFQFDIRDDDACPRVTPIEDASEVEWLLCEPGDSAVLTIARRTMVITDPAPPEETAAVDPAAATDALGGKAVSAGQHLRTYLKGKRPQRPTPPGPASPDRTA
jgi:pSer/pThr/pTyr-binding forkhead associated (FHA) protein